MNIVLYSPSALRSKRFPDGRADNSFIVGFSISADGRKKEVVFLLPKNH